MYIRKDQEEALQQLQEVTRVPTAIRIRDGIDAILKRHEDDLG